MGSREPAAVTPVVIRSNAGTDPLCPARHPSFSAWGWFCPADQPAPHRLLQHLHELVDLIQGVVEVRTCAHHSRTVVDDDPAPGEMRNRISGPPVPYQNDRRTRLPPVAHTKRKPRSATPFHEPLRECHVLRANRRHPDLVHDLLPAQRGMHGGKRGSAQFEAPCVLVVAEITGIELELILGGEPAGNGGFEFWNEGVADVEVGQAGPAAEPLERPRGIEVDACRGKVDRHLATPLVAVDQAVRASAPRDVGDGLQILDRPGREEDVAGRDRQRPIVHRFGELLRVDVDAVGALQHHHLRIGPYLPLVQQRGEIQLGRDNPVALAPVQAGRNRRQARGGRGHERDGPGWRAE